MTKTISPADQRKEEYAKFVEDFFACDVVQVYKSILIQMIVQDVKNKLNAQNKLFLLKLINTVDGLSIQVADKKIVPAMLPNVLADYFYSLSDQVVPEATDPLATNNENSAVIKNAELERRMMWMKLRLRGFQILSAVLGVVVVGQIFLGSTVRTTQGVYPTPSENTEVTKE